MRALLDKPRELPAFPAGLGPEEFDALAGEYPFVPGVFYRQMAPPGAFERFARGWLRKLVSGAAGCFAAWRGRRVRGVACWRRLAWDSEQFGFPAARIDALIAPGAYAGARRRNSALLEALLEDCRAAGVEHLTARVDAGDLAAIHALEGAGFELLDGIQTFSRDLMGGVFAPVAAGVEVREFREGDLDALLAIARSAYTCDRFHADRALSGEVADRVNESWVRNSCRRQGADAVVVACRDGEPLGYVTCQLDHDLAPLIGAPLGRIVMVATAAQARGRGLARAATLGAMEWFRNRGAGAVEVGTQLRNVPASRLYESCGFRLAGVGLTWRKLPQPEGIAARPFR